MYTLILIRDLLHLLQRNVFLGAFHGADLKFLFDMDVDKMLPQYTDKNWQNDKRVTEVFSQLLTNFAKYR